MAYIAPEITRIGTTSGVVLGNFSMSNNKDNVAPDWCVVPQTEKCPNQISSTTEW